MKFPRNQRESPIKGKRGTNKVRKETKRVERETNGVEKGTDRGSEDLIEQENWERSSRRIDVNQERHETKQEERNLERTNLTPRQRARKEGEPLIKIKMP